MRAHPDALPMTSAYFQLILREYGGVPRDRAALLAGTGIAEPTLAASAGEITLGQQLCQIRNANRLLPSDWALTIGTRLHAATHGPVGFAVVSAPTVRAALGIMTRFGSVRSPHFRLRASIEGDVMRLVPEDRVVLADEERQRLLDLVLLSMQGMVEASLGRPMHAGWFERDGVAPGLRGRHADCFHAPVRFGRREPAIVLPTAWLDVECPLGDASMFAASLQTLLAAERRLAGGGSWVDRVEQQVAVQRGRASLDDVARTLGVSRRTLVRRLGDAGTSFRAVLERGQRRHAEALLREPGLGVAEVAWAVGYEDAANFGRACRRWFGMSPGRYRARLQGDD
ncbi:MAG TPA: AraC family transcriptional regulator ligand-binding domain-containing protein [Candidatus Binatia bacterium]|jgi:AraC-like DNA-binding protein|nr:AraC family transcriptional regulator ligand-binding domain-containing protein [Candidatus Binatia bacterium]